MGKLVLEKSIIILLVTFPGIVPIFLLFTDVGSQFSLTFIFVLLAKYLILITVFCLQMYWVWFRRVLMVMVTIASLLTLVKLFTFILYSEQALKFLSSLITPSAIPLYAALIMVALIACMLVRSNHLVSSSQSEQV